MKKRMIEWEDYSENWETPYLSNFLHFHSITLSSAIQFFGETVRSLGETESGPILTYNHVPDYISSVFHNDLKDVDMRIQTMTALAFIEVYKIFTVEYVQFMTMLQRSEGMPFEKRGISEFGFLKKGRQIWPDDKISNELDKLYQKFIHYNMFRNKLAHNMICRMEYNFRDKAFENFLEEMPGIIFLPDHGIINRPRTTQNTKPNNTDSVRNIYTFQGGGFVSKFCEDSILLFTNMIRDFYPDFKMPDYIKK